MYREITRVNTVDTKQQKRNENECNKTLTTFAGTIRKDFGTQTPANPHEQMFHCLHVECDRYFSSVMLHGQLHSHAVHIVRCEGLECRNCDLE